jgi:hypothetical protein
MKTMNSLLTRKKKELIKIFALDQIALSSFLSGTIGRRLRFLGSFSFFQWIFHATTNFTSNYKNTAASSDVNIDSSAVFGALLRCVTPRQILNMEESGVIAQPFKGKKKNMFFWLVV